MKTKTFFFFLVLLLALGFVGCSIVDTGPLVKELQILNKRLDESTKQTERLNQNFNNMERELKKITRFLASQ